MPKTATLYLLGTDTEYKQAKDPDCYYQQESLSFCYDHTCGDYKHIIDGPDTLGTNVGEKIALSVIKVIDWLKYADIETVNIAAHSRGAVQAILVAHELEALQKYSGDLDLSLHEVLSKTPCVLTKAGYKTYKD